jgi:aspartyl/glutamyl-tRNA(Asn/Gln) amidotransferase C subunit
MVSREDASALDIAAVRHVAKLARLRLEDAEAERYRGQLASILGHISKLNAIDMTGVEPMAHPLPLTNRLADDVPAPSMPIDDLLRNAPAREARFLAVPKVLADGGGA